MNLQDLKTLSRPFIPDKLAAEPPAVSIDVSEADRAELAKAYDVTDISMLKADVDLNRNGDLVRVAGTLEAELGRTCVVSLEPLREVINENFALVYTTAELDEVVGEHEADLDAPEPIEGDIFDAGQAVLEQLVLAMSAHPRKEDAQPPEDPGQGKESSPFDVLKSLKS